ncbi:hypothetical protein J4573_47695 [Actinomadura barringtoniae]|uniref:Sensor domain-containing protein n=1 Tax=Actinomadura barringtoniae TaxID=1427535 RepID=A0A939PML7_9ACTN|nr:hypothetical protein [Actinomadura barringtoniae]MBO2454843.1 hypothetical protein [Actinomadura barringtoniae]
MRSSLAAPAARPVLAAPFTADTWRRTAYAVVALPATLPSLIGRPAQPALARRFLGTPLPARRRPFRTALHALVSLPLNLLAFLIAMYGWSLVLANLLYPLRIAVFGGTWEDAWGGPTLAGAWAVHSLGGFAFLFITPLLLRWVTRVQERLIVRVVKDV